MEDSIEGQAPIEGLRPYLRAIARMQLEEQFQAKIDASDIVQETMLEAHRGLANYRGSSPEELRGWLRKILARNIADEVRKFRRGKRDADLERSLEAGLTNSSMCLEQCVAANISSPDRRAMNEEQLILLSMAIEALPDDQRQAVTRHHLKGQSAAEIATAMERTEVAIAGLLRRGLKQLRELMRDENVD